ncbi:MAG: hypothetical protein AAGD25_06450 [Cyanobacteria bacterium P01_F01_bin.150]
MSIDRLLMPRKTPWASEFYLDGKQKWIFLGEKSIFLHFTLRKNLASILKSGCLLTGDDRPASACISGTYGHSYIYAYNVKLHSLTQSLSTSPWKALKGQTEYIAIVFESDPRKWLHYEEESVSKKSVQIGADYITASVQEAMQLLENLDD